MLIWMGVFIHMHITSVSAFGFGGKVELFNRMAYHG